MKFLAKCLAYRMYKLNISYFQISDFYFLLFSYFLIFFLPIPQEIATL